MISLIERIKEEEGFSGVVYKDSLGIDTIGRGTKLPITKKEASLLLEYRLNKKVEKLNKIIVFQNLPQDKKDIIIEMAYQLGVSGVKKFKNMWFNLSLGNYKEASIEMLNSKWAKQTPKRAKRLAKRMRDI